MVQDEGKDSFGSIVKHTYSDFWTKVVADAADGINNKIDNNIAAAQGINYAR